MRGRIRCEDCWKRETQIGPSHPRWDSDKTQQEREAERGLLQKVWSREVLRRANYTCAVSGKVGGSLEAHHLFNWNDYPNLRGDPGNGVALQRSLHKKFHALYGQKLNTPEQFEEFRRTVSVP